MSPIERITGRGGNDMSSTLHSVWAGIRLGFGRFLWRAFLAYSALWTSINSASYFLWRPEDRSRSGWRYLGVILLSLIIGAWLSRRKRSVTIRTNMFDTEIPVLFGNVFDEPGLVTVSVNEFFDSQLGDHVAKTSLHGTLIRDHFGGHPEAFDKCVTNSLAGLQYEEVPRTSGKTRRYPIGTTALVETDSRRFLCVALTRTDTATLKASADVQQLWAGVIGLLRKARVASNGQPLSIPLIGSGLAGVGLPAAHIVELLLLAICEESKRQKICDTIRIVLPESKFEEIDLNTIEHCWR